MTELFQSKCSLIVSVKLLFILYLVWSSIFLSLYCVFLIQLPHCALKHGGTMPSEVNCFRMEHWVIRADHSFLLTTGLGSLVRTCQGALWGGYCDSYDLSLQPGRQGLGHDQELGRHCLSVTFVLSASKQLSVAAPKLNG